MSLENFRVDKAKLEEDISISITKFCQSHDVMLNDIEYTVHCVQDKEDNDPVVLMVDVKINVKL